LYSKLYLGAQQVGAEGIRFHAAQAEGCSPIAQAWQQGREVSPVKADSRAQSLAIGNPADGNNALKTAEASGGQITSVAEDDLPTGLRTLAQYAGVLTESAGAVTTLGAQTLAEQGYFQSEDRVVLVITGDGLKGMDLVEDAVRVDHSCPADPETVLEYLTNNGVVCEA
jgi:threonine synthase